MGRWLEERQLEQADFIPVYSFYAQFRGRPGRLKKLGLEHVDVLQKGKVRKGTNLLNAYNLGQVVLEALAGVYIYNTCF
jgi:hypothetical protein